MDFSWLWIVPVLGVLVVIHELGHFVSARLLGIKVEEFGVGFPPRIFAIRRNGIDYSLNWLPIGGFVKIVGENGDSDDPASFGRAAAWKRIIVLAAGPFMNVLLAFIIFSGMAISGTVEIDAPSTGVGSVMASQPADKAGMKPGDRIVSVAGQPVSNSDQIRSLSRQHAGTVTDFVVDRSGQTLTLKITPNPNPPNGTAYLGISLDYWVSPAKVSTVRPGGVADKAGLKPGDIIVKVDNTTVNNLPVVTYLLSTATKSPQVTVQRDGQTVGPLTLDVGTGTQKSYGLALNKPQHVVYYSPTQALGKALGNTWDVVSNIPKGIGQAFSGQAQGPGVTGPVGIAQLTGEVAQEGGINALLNLTALLGISLFLINILPLPALDGGRLLFILIEMVRGGRRIAPEKEGMVHFAGMMVLLALMLIITVFDVQRLFEGVRLLP
jgi:regulator of sigma E protease